MQYYSMDTQNVKSGQNGQTDDVKFVKLVNEKMIREIMRDIETGIRETEKMIRDIDTEFKKLNDDLTSWVSNDATKNEFERCLEIVQVENHKFKVVELQCELWKNHTGTHFFNSFSFGDEK